MEHPIKVPYVCLNCYHGAAWQSSPSLSELSRYVQASNGQSFIFQISLLLGWNTCYCVIWDTLLKYPMLALNCYLGAAWQSSPSLSELSRHVQAGKGLTKRLISVSPGGNFIHLFFKEDCSSLVAKCIGSVSCGGLQLHDLVDSSKVDAYGDDETRWIGAWLLEEQETLWIFLEK